MTTGEKRKQLEIDLNRQLGITASQEDVIQARVIAAELAGEEE